MSDKQREPKKKPKYEWVVQSYTGSQYGWETAYVGENREDAKARLNEYRENEPNTPHRLKFRREPKEEA